MRTREMVTRLQRRLNDLTRPEILDYINRINDVIYSSNVEQFKVPFTNSGLPPYLATTNNQYTYDCPSDCRRTTAVFAENVRTYSTRGYNSRYREYIFRNRTYYGIPVRTMDATEDNLATVTFIDNPGTTTERYFHLYFVTPTRILSEDVEFLVPYGVSHEKIIRGVFSLVRSEVYGNNAEWDKWERRDLNDIRYQLNLGAQGGIHATLNQMENRDYTDSPYERW